MRLNPFSRSKSDAVTSGPPVPLGQDLESEIRAAIGSERERVAALLALAEAGGRRTLAIALACDGASVADAKIALASTPTEEKPARPWQMGVMEEMVENAQKGGQADAD